MAQAGAVANSAAIGAKTDNVLLKNVFMLFPPLRNNDDSKASMFICR